MVLAPRHVHYSDNPILTSSKSINPLTTPDKLSLSLSLSLCMRIRMAISRRYPPLSLYLSLSLARARSLSQDKRALMTISPRWAPLWLPTRPSTTLALASPVCDACVCMCMCMCVCVCVCIYKCTNDCMYTSWASTVCDASARNTYMSCL